MGLKPRTPAPRRGAEQRDAGDLIVRLPDAGAWHRWLAAHHAQQEGVLLAIAKKGGAAVVAHLQRGARRGSGLGLDRRAEARPRPPRVVAAVLAAPGQEPLVQAQPRPRRGADRRRRHAAARAGRGRPRPRRRPLGRGLRLGPHLHRAARPGPGPGRRPRRPRLLRPARLRQPLRGPLPGPARRQRSRPAPAASPTSSPCCPAATPSTRPAVAAPASRGAGHCWWTGAPAGGSSGGRRSRRV